MNNEQNREGANTTREGRRGKCHVLCRTNSTRASKGKPAKLHVKNPLQEGKKYDSMPILSNLRSVHAMFVVAYRSVTSTGARPARTASQAQSRREFRSSWTGWDVRHTLYGIYGRMQNMWPGSHGRIC